MSKKQISTTSLKYHTIEDLKDEIRYLRDILKQRGIPFEKVTLAGNKDELKKKVRYLEKVARQNGGKRKSQKGGMDRNLKKGLAILGAKGLATGLKQKAKQTITGKIGRDEMVIGCVGNKDDPWEVKQKYGEKHCYYGGSVSKKGGGKYKFSCKEQGSQSDCDNVKTQNGTQGCEWKSSKIRKAGGRCVRSKDGWAQRRAEDMIRLMNEVPGMTPEEAYKMTDSEI